MSDEIKLTKKQVYEHMKKLYPGVSIIEIYYTGAGDSFDYFDDPVLKDSSGNAIMDRPEWDSTLHARDYQHTNGKLQYPPDDPIIKEYLFNVLDASQFVSFNDEGSYGYIILDLDNYVTKLECTWNGDYVDDDEDDPDRDPFEEDRDAPDEFF